MKITYYPETDSLYIDLSEHPGAECVEISESVVADYDTKGNLVGIDIDNASKKVELKKFTLSKLPAMEQIIEA
jgi:uncharacterized protein YuzE